MSAVDQIDKGIFYALDANCRISYEDLARRFNLSANAIKKRVMKLQELGVIKRFTVWLSLAMINAEMFVAIASTDSNQNDEALINAIGNSPMVHRVAPLANEDIMVFGEKNPITGQMVTAQVKLSTDESISEFRKRMRQFCRDKLANYKIPQKVVLVDRDLYGDRFKKLRKGL